MPQSWDQEWHLKVCSEENKHEFAVCTADLWVLCFHRQSFGMHIYSCANLLPAESPSEQTQEAAQCRLFRFGTIKYCIGGQLYSADDIEHGILRGNRPTAASLPVLLGHPEWSNGYFKKDDPRLSQVWSKHRPSTTSNGLEEKSEPLVAL